MSSYVVEDETINKVVSYFANGRNIEWIQRQLAAAGYDLETYQGKEKLGIDMFRLNLQGTNERYGGGVEDFRPIDYKYRSEINYTPISALKSLACWLYQCAEGETVEKPLYKLMSEIKGELAYHILCHTEEYNLSKWG